MKYISQFTYNKSQAIRLLIVNCLLLTVPLVAYAAPQNFKGLINLFLDILDKAIPLVYLLSFLYFFWGIAKYIFSAGSEDQKNEAKNVMTWGLIAIFVLTSFFGILKLFGGAFFPNMSQYSSPQPTYEGIDRSDESWRNVVDPNTGLPFPELQDPRYMGGGGI